MKMKKKNRIITLVLVLIIVGGIFFSIGAFAAMKGYLRFLVSPLQPYFGKRFDNNLNLNNTIAQVIPQYSFNAKTYEEYLEWKEEALPMVYDLVGIGKERIKLNNSNVDIVEREEIDGLTRYKIYIDSNYGVSVPCYMFIPENNGEKLPAVLVPSGLGEGIIQTSGQVESYQNGNAKFLAEKGFVTLTCENRGFGELGHVDYMRINANALLIGKTYYGISLEDQQFALDFLASRKVVDKNKIGVAGVSFGGAMSMYLAVIDERIKTAVVMGYLSQHKNAFTNGDHSPISNIPNLITYFEMSDIASLIAPKKVLYSNGEYDGFKSKEAAGVLLKIQEAYTLLNTTNNVRYVEHKGGHTFDNELAYEFLKGELMG